jgi:hypothetical protein
MGKSVRPILQLFARIYGYFQVPVFCYALFGAIALSVDLHCMHQAPSTVFFPRDILTLTFLFAVNPDSPEAPTNRKEIAYFLSRIEHGSKRSSILRKSVHVIAYLTGYSSLNIGSIINGSDAADPPDRLNKNGTSVEPPRCTAAPTTQDKGGLKAATFDFTSPAPSHVDNPDHFPFTMDFANDELAAFDGAFNFDFIPPSSFIFDAPTNLSISPSMSETTPETVGPRTETDFGGDEADSFAFNLPDGFFMHPPSSGAKSPVPLVETTPFTRSLDISSRTF